MFHRRHHPAATIRAVRNRRRFRPQLTALENRALLSTYTVANTNDSGVGSLRYEIGLATADSTNDTVTFSSLFNTAQTITLTSGQLVLTKNTGTLTIQGPGETLLSVSGKNASRVFYLHGGSAYLSGLTVSGGSATYGAGMANYGAKATLADCTVSGNSATKVGGGLFSEGGTASLTMTECTVSGNSASDGGGGLGNLGGKATLIYCTVSGNNSASEGGGGLFNLDGTATLTNCTVSSNNGRNGLYNIGGAATLTNCSVSGNEEFGLVNEDTSTLTMTNCTVGGNKEDGLVNYDTSTLFMTNCSVSGNNGGLINSSATATLTSCTVSGNSATGEGGGLFNVGGTATLTNCTVSDNSATYGGALFNGGGTATLINCTVSDNFAKVNIGGLLNGGGTATKLTLTNCTVSGNSAAAAIGGLYNDGTATLSNCTVSGNSALSVVGGVLFAAGTATLNNTIVAGDTGGDTDGSYSGSNNFIGGNPLLAALGNYGGPTQTMPPLPGSPVIGAGSTALIPAGITTDQRGEPRIVNGTVDLGAVESQGYRLTPANGSTPQSAFIGSAFANPLTAIVTPNYASDPVNGGVITFTAPTSGASATLSAASTAIAGGSASVNATANSTAGSYTVTASASGVPSPVAFSLTNLTPVVPPTVTSPTVTDVTSSTATLGGDVTSDGGATITKRGVLYALTSTNGNPTLGGSGVNEVDDPSASTGTFSEGVTGLIPGSGYSFVAFATNSAGTSYTAPASTFTTLAAAPPTVTSPTVTDVTSSTAALGADVTSNGGGTITDRGVLYALTSANRDPTLGGSGVTEVDDPSATTGTFSENVTGLTSLADYSFVAFATNSAGTAYTTPVSTFETTEMPGLVVNTTSDTVNPFDGKTSLREAIAYAATLGASPTITFASGLTGTIDLGSGLAIGSNVTIDGPGASSLTVSGGGPSSNFSVFTVNYGATASIFGLTIANGYTSGDGGGIAVVGAVTLNNVTLSDNSASEGGGIDNFGAATLNNVTLSGNSATNGGGVANHGGANLANVILVGNSAMYGGGVANYYNATLANVTFVVNSATYGGGAVANDGTITMTGATLSGNSATNYGGAVDNFGTVTLNDVTLSENSATNYGGGVYNYYTAALTNVTFLRNSASSGGGLLNVGTATLIDVTLSENSATNYGGGLFMGGAATLTNCTVSGNSAAIGGGLDNYSGTATLSNTIVAGNTAGADVVGPLAPASSNNFIGGNPLLAALGNYGGPTQTMPPLPGSPVIGAGNSALAVDAQGNPFTTDQRGEPRTVNGTVDIGAVESQGYMLTPGAGSTPQTAFIGATFTNPLAVGVTPNYASDPVNGGVITFTAPTSGASATLSAASATITNGAASVNATTNATAGSYVVSASAVGVSTPASFHLTNLPSLPSWLATGSAATWNAGTKTLTVTGAATITADPGSDAPNIVASGAAAVLTIQPTTVGFVNLGGITLTGGASIVVPSVGAARTHTYHNVIVLDSNGTTVPTFSIDSSSKLDMGDNDLIIQNGGSELSTVQGLAQTGADYPNNDWTGKGLTSSVAASNDANQGYEQTLLAVALNGSLPSGPFTSWQAGSGTLALGPNDIIVKYTYNGDFNLDGMVDDSDAGLLSAYYAPGVPYGPPGSAFEYGDTNGDGYVDDSDAGLFGVLYGLGTPGSGTAQL